MRLGLQVTINNSNRRNVITLIWGPNGSWGLMGPLGPQSPWGLLAHRDLMSLLTVVNTVVLKVCPLKPYSNRPYEGRQTNT